MGKYEIKLVIIIKRFENHIPYFLGMIIKGPKGGQYYLDEFCTEVMLKHKYGSLVLPYTLTRITTHIGTKLNVLEVFKDGSDVNHIISNIKATKLIRLEGKDKARVIGESLNLDLDDIIKNIM